MNQTNADHILAANEELLNKGNAGAVADFFTPSYVVHVAEQDMRGHKMVKGFVNELGESFADLRVEVDVLISEGDRVAWQCTIRATHQAAFKGFPASGRTIVWRDMIVTRSEDGKIAEEWAVSDLAERLLITKH